MLYVGSRDERKGLGLGFGVARRMEETELEEGEACYYQDEDASVDPFVSLSYLDVKLQNVLGHFQKDFEGGVSAENLGAKFGGYGSFLPAYQRSPAVLSHPRTPQDVQNYNTPKSPNSLPVEGVRQQSTVPSGLQANDPLSMRVGPAYGGSPRGALESTPKNEHLSKLIKPTDQKTLKVRIKMGNESLVGAQKNAAIYSGLGLDISPSSSLEGSPVESAGMSPDTREAADESPTRILEIMTSLPVPESLLLSPLPDSLLNLTEKESFVRDSISRTACKGSQENAVILRDDHGSIIGNERKILSVEKNEGSLELMNENGRDAGNEISALLKRDLCSENLGGKELANALKMPHPSNSKCTFVGSINGPSKSYNMPKEANKGMVNDKFSSHDMVNEKVLESRSSEEVCRNEKLHAETNLPTKVREDKKASSRKDISVGSRKNEKCKGEQSYDLFKADFDISKGRKGLNSGPVNPPKQRFGQKATSNEQDGLEMSHTMEQPLPGAKKKLKGSQSFDISSSELPKESLRVGSSAVMKDKKKITHASSHLSKSKGHDKKSHKGLVKARHSYGDIFGDLNLEQAEGSMDMLDTPKDKQKDSMLAVAEKEIPTFVDKSRDRSNSKKGDNMLTSELYTKGEPNATPPLTGNGPIYDAIPAVVAPVLIEENWVCCDKCQEWRLLPFGTNPKDLPKKWLCSMQTWLPGMNRCNISEEETTKALNALYQVPVPESQNNLQAHRYRDHPDGGPSGVTLDDIQNIGKKNLELSLHVHGGRKKKHGSKEISNAASHSGHTQLSDPAKKSQQASAKSRSLNGVNQSPFESNPLNKSDFHHSRKLVDQALEKDEHKQKEKHGLLNCHSDGGDVKRPKIKSKREDDQDRFRASKMIKTQDVYCTDEDVYSDHGGAIGRMDPGSSSGLPTKASGTDIYKYNEYSSSKDSKCDAKKSILVSVKKPRDRVQVSLDDVSQHVERCGEKDDVSKKRKMKGSSDSNIYLETLQTNEHHLQDNIVSVKEASEGERHNGKKARVSKSGCKETSTSKGEDRIDKKGKVTRILLSGNRNQPVDCTVGERSVGNDKQLEQYQGNTLQSMDGVDSLKRDLGYVQPSTAATSSSSKVSGSCKIKANFQEVKGSPVESVSSSPLRFSNPDNFTSSRRNLFRKDNARDDGFSVMASPRRCSGGEGDGGSDRSGTGRKEKTFSVAYRGYLDSDVLDDQDRDAKDTSGGKSRTENEPSSELECVHLANGGSDTLDRNNQYSRELLTKDHCNGEERVNNHSHANGSVPHKSGKGSTSRSKGKYRSSKTGFDRGKVKIPDSFSAQEELYSMKRLKFEAELDSRNHACYNEEIRDGKHVIKDKSGVKPKKDEMRYSNMKDSAGKWSSETSKRESQSKFGGREVSNVKLGTISSKDGKINPQKPNHEGKSSLNQFLSDRNDKMEVKSGKGKSLLCPISGDKQENPNTYPRAVPTSQKGGGSDGLPVDASGGDAAKALKQLRKPDNKNGVHDSGLRHRATSNGHGVRDVNVPSPVRKDSSSQATGNAVLKDAKDLKHKADRLKNSGLDLESTELYFQAALKFLQGASLLEPCNSDSFKHGEMTQSMHVYSSTAKLCEFCAHEYEKRKFMAAAALAYKCMEVAYMRVIYYRRSVASRDRQELQTALQMIPPGESPSSSASDVDNLINQATLGKAALTKGIGSPQAVGNHVAKDINSPQVTGNHVIVAGNRPNFVRLLDFTQDVYSAMEASMKSQNAFAVANVSLEEGQFGDGISSVKRVLDFNFHDVEGLLRLVRLALEAISRLESQW